MTLKFPPELIGFEVRLSVPGAEEYLLGVVPEGGVLEKELPNKLYHVSYRPKGGPWRNDPLTTILDLQDS